MRDRRAQPAAARKHAAGLSHGLRHLVHVVQAHVGHHEAERLIAERQRGRVGEHGRRRGVVADRQAHHGRRGVDSGDPVAAGAQEPAEPALAAAQVQGRSSRLRQEVEQGGHVDGVVRAVTAWRSGKCCPFPRLSFPAIPHSHPAKPATFRRRRRASRLSVRRLTTSHHPAARTACITSEVQALTPQSGFYECRTVANLFCRLPQPQQSVAPRQRGPA